MLRAVEHVVLAIDLGGETDARRTLDVIRLEQGEGPDRRAVGEAREPARCCAAEPASSTAVVARAVERSGDGSRLRPVSSSNTTKSTQVRPAPTVLLGHEQTEPAERGHLVPELRRVCVRGRHALAHLGHRAPLVEQLAHRIAQEILFFREAEIHVLLILRRRGPKCTNSGRSCSGSGDTRAARQASPRGRSLPDVASALKRPAEDTGNARRVSP